MSLTLAETAAARALIALALAEGIGDAGDRTSLATIPAGATAAAAFVARSTGVVAGLPVLILDTRKTPPPTGGRWRNWPSAMA